MGHSKEPTLHEMAEIIATRNVTRLLFEFRWDSKTYRCPVLDVRSEWTNQERNYNVDTLVDLPMAMLDPNVTRADIVRRQLIEHTISARDCDYRSHQTFVRNAPKVEQSLLHEELRCIINKLSLENGSDTPDYILADFLIGCLKQFNETMARRNSHNDGTV